jgi:HPt (histidine-containing phosphotransfer) domain-containing protein
VSADDALDPAALQYLLEITGGDEAFLDELVETFVHDAHDQLRSLREAVEAGSVEGLVRPAHSLKSNAANVGATRLAELCRDLEADARAGMVAAPAERVAAIEAEFAVVHDALREVRGSAG